jgi:glucose/arabinose dehydrogenase
MTRPIISLFVLFFSALLLPIHAAQASEPYRVAGDCAGFPKTALLSVPCTCVGLVAQGLGFPRGVAVQGANVYVVDMGGWTHHRGRLLLLGASGHDKPVALLTGLDEPSALKFGPDGNLYIGQLGEIDRVNLAANPVSLTPVLLGLPATGRHPLTAFAFGPQNALFVNIGSATDHCEGPADSAPDTAAPCPETTQTPPRASVIEARIAPGIVTRAAAAKIIATGLRNSEGLMVLPNGEVVAAVNGRDYIGLADPNLNDEQEPADTLDVLHQGADFGWPYCFDANRPDPAYPAYDCAAKTAPTILLPAHAAVLDLLLYQGSAIPALAHTLLLPYHGYRKNGHRIMAMPLDSTGGLSDKFQPIVWGWDFHDGINPQGNPVGLAELPDGSILMTEDHNGTLLRLAKA